MNYDEYFISLAKVVASKSKDPSTKVGAVIVGPGREVRSTGYNGFPRRVKETPERWARPFKYQLVCHAELNSILQAARSGVSVLNCSLYISTNSIPCASCAAAVIQAGIIEVVGPVGEFPGKGSQWEESLKLGRDILLEAGVLIRTVECGSQNTDKVAWNDSGTDSTKSICG